MAEGIKKGKKKTRAAWKSRHQTGKQDGGKVLWVILQRKPNE